MIKRLHFRSISHMENYFRKKQIPIDSWKTKRTKTLKDLFAEHKTRLCILEEVDGKPRRLVSSVMIDVCIALSEKVRFRLEEKTLRSSDGEVWERTTHHTLSRKLGPDDKQTVVAQDTIRDKLRIKASFAIVERKPMEFAFDTVTRTLEEERGFDGYCLFIELGPEDVSDGDPETYQGLPSMRRHHVILCAIPKSLLDTLKLQGVTRTFEGKKTHYKWELLSPSAMERYAPPTLRVR